MAIALFKHSTIGKAKQAQPYHAAARARYIMRQSAAMRVFSENMPINWHAVQRFLKEHEDGLRKNGRVADTFVIAIPKEFTPEAAEVVLRAYGKRIGKGKAPFLVAFHWDEHNPHAHMIFIDRDPETGKRVFGTSERNSTELLKFEWATEVNEQFEQMGLETRISFHTQTEALAVNDNEVSKHSPTPPEVEPEPPEVVSEPTLEELDNDLGRVDYAEELEQALATQEADLADFPTADDVEDWDTPEVRQEGVDRYQQAYEAAVELRSIREKRARYREVHEVYELSKKLKSQATAYAEASAIKLRETEIKCAEIRENYINNHINIIGKKKGFSFSAFGYTYTSKARKAADSAERDYAAAKIQVSLAEGRVADAHAELYIAKTDAERFTAEYEKVQGKDTELAEAASLYENTFHANAGDLTPEQVTELVQENKLQPKEAALILKELGYTEEARDIGRDI